MVSLCVNKLDRKCSNEDISKDVLEEETEQEFEVSSISILGGDSRMSCKEIPCSCIHNSL